MFAVRRLFIHISYPLGVLLAGGLADGLLEPALHPGGPLVPGLGWLVGSGAGAGMGLLLVTAGILGAVVGGLGYLSPALRSVEATVPDFDVQQA